MQYFLSLGSNINAQKNIKFAMSELQEIFLDLKSSSTYQTKAEGFEGEDFLNLVTSGTSLLSFEALNKKLKGIEDSAGRDRNGPKFGSRALDIDIVLQVDEQNEIVFESDEVKKYKFVSDPLKELI
jgi:2-amino-4-hydroxy-6-hydroxymethyldihydropteridine diphosphokinase|tara:strand:+ start:197 stop:574 length:378 start_codon:yes stop_codon:yes gene_type:complete